MKEKLLRNTLNREEKKKIFLTSMEGKKNKKLDIVHEDIEMFYCLLTLFYFFKFAIYHHASHQTFIFVCHHMSLTILIIDFLFFLFVKLFFFYQKIIYRIIYKFLKTYLMNNLQGKKKKRFDIKLFFFLY